MKVARSLSFHKTRNVGGSVDAEIELGYLATLGLVVKGFGYF